MLKKNIKNAIETKKKRKERGERENTKGERRERDFYTLVSFFIFF